MCVWGGICAEIKQKSDSLDLQIRAKGRPEEDHRRSIFLKKYLGETRHQPEDFRSLAVSTAALAAGTKEVLRRSGKIG